MRAWRRWRHSLAQQRWLLIIVAVIVYLFYHLISGDRGLLALGRLQQDVQAANTQEAQLASEVATMERNVKALRPGTIDPDMVDERARIMLGYTRPDEVVILTPPPHNPPEKR